MGGGATVRLYVSNYIRKVTMVLNLECCDNFSCADAYKRTAVIKLYGGLTSTCRDYLGEVSYGHLSNAIATSRDMTTSDYVNGIFVGNITAGTCSTCYTNPHVHGECKYGTLIPVNGAPLSAGGTVIFRFVVPSICTA